MDTILKLNDQLMGLPSGVLIGAFAICVGYILKYSNFNNRNIPVVIVNICAGAFMLMAPPKNAETAARIYWAKNFIIGYVVGFAAWAFHAKLLKKWIDPKIFDGDEEQISQITDQLKASADKLDASVKDNTKP